MPTSDPVQARDQRFDHIRRYARYSDFKEIWPLFHYTEGRLDELRSPVIVGPYGEEHVGQVDLYSYALLEVAGRYTLVRFNMGVDHWAICLDDPLPHLVIRAVFPDMALDFLWYPDEQWRTGELQ